MLSLPFTNKCIQHIFNNYTIFLEYYAEFHNEIKLLFNICI